MMTASDGWAAMAILYTFGPIALIAIFIALISLVVSLAKKENKGILTKIFLWTISLVFLYFIYLIYCGIT